MTFEAHYFKNSWRCRLVYNADPTE